MIDNIYSPVPYPEKVSGLGLVGLLIVIGAVGILVWYGWKSNVDTHKDTIHELLLELKTLSFSTTIRVREKYFMMSHVIHTFFERCFAVQTFSMSTNELIQELQSLDLENELIHSWASFLNSIDQKKFSQRAVMMLECETDIQSLIALIRATRVDHQGQGEPCDLKGGVDAGRFVASGMEYP